MSHYLKKMILIIYYIETHSIELSFSSQFYLHKWTVESVTEKSSFMLCDAKVLSYIHIKGTGIDCPNNYTRF